MISDMEAVGRVWGWRNVGGLVCAEVRKASFPEVKWSEVAQSCPTLFDSMDCSLPGSSIHGIFQARILEWVAISFSIPEEVTVELRQEVWLCRDPGSEEFRWREQLCKGPLKGMIREHREAKVLGRVGGGKWKRRGGVSGGEKLRKVSSQYPQKGNVRRQKAGCLGLEEQGRLGSDA